MAIKRRFSYEQFTGEYWVLVHSDRQDGTRNGAPVRPIDMPYGMLVFSNEENAFAAANEQFRLYGLACRPQLLVPPPPLSEDHSAVRTQLKSM
jgi:hypothetical protein